MPSPIIMTIASVFKSAGLNAARQALTGASKDFNSLASNIGQAAGAFGAFQAISSSREFLLESVDLAQRLERNMLGVKQVFESATPTLKTFIEQVDAYGISQSQAAQASVFLGSVLKQYGFDTQEAASETQRLVTLAQDLATTYGYDVQEALLAITALFRGEFDPIEKFGVAMKQNEINARLAAEGFGDLEGEALAYASAQTRLTMLFERADDSVGAFARAQDTLYVAQSRLRAETENLQIAFGEALQRPITNIIGSFAELVDGAAPEFVEISEALGDAIDNVAPTVTKLGEGLLNLTSLLQPVVELVGILGAGLGLVLNPALDTLNVGLSGTNQFFDTLSARTAAVNYELERFKIIAQDDALLSFLLMLDGPREPGRLVEFLIFLNDELVRSEQSLRAVTGDFEGFDNGAKSASVSLRGAGYAAREAAAELEAAAKSTAYFESNLKSLGLETRDADGNLQGLAKVFADIDEAARSSEAKEALEDIGFAAGQIETILTSPDWEAIFTQISTLAKLAAIDIANVKTIAMEQNVFEAKRALEELRAGITVTGRGGSTGAEAAKDFVGDFLAGIADEVKKQTARGKLEKLGVASEGLLDAIFGANGWEKLYKSILKGGTDYLADLQDQFEKTADGLREINDALEDERKAAEAAAKETARILEEQEEAIARYNEEAQRRLDLAMEFRETITSAALVDVLDDQERKIGRFESSVSGSFDQIFSGLERAFDNETILEDAYRELVAYANAEKAALTSIQRQRDEVADRINLSEALIKEYKNAFTASANLVTMLNQIETKTKKVTVTEMTEGMVTLNSSLKEFKVTLTRSFEEAQEETVNKTDALINDFRKITDKSKTFAQNLRTLRDMGLNPMLFNQLVEAGVEAGGETAQALVDGGVETVSEVSALFREIDALGADLGEEVASTMYGAGVDMSNGLIEGLKSQAEALKTTAETLANGFADAFTARIDAAVADALKKLASINAPAAGSQPTFIDTSQMPEGGIQFLPEIGSGVSTGIMPAPVLPTMPLQPGPGLGMPTFNIYADSRYGGYQAATSFTAYQSRLATNNAGISSFMKI